MLYLTLSLLPVINNFVFKHLFSGLWSTPVTTGETPLPCFGFSFVKVNDATVILFGGYVDAGFSNDLYTLDINNMVKRKQ